eukprot:sb/3463122/
MSGEVEPTSLLQTVNAVIGGVKDTIDKADQMRSTLPRGVTSLLSELLKMILRPFEKRLPHLMRDSTDFLGCLKDSVARESTMVAIDIVALYPSISNKLGNDALEYWMTRYPELLGNFTKEFVTDLLSLIQENVYMTFNDDTFRQIEGTAMGKSHAPPYANLVVAFLICTKLLPDIEQNYNTNTAEHLKGNLKLFLDDGFMFLEEKYITATEKFTMETSSKELPFLDVMVKLKPDMYNASKAKVTTDLYSKPTDSFSYLHFKSCAPRHLKRNIPYCLARRIATIVSNEEQRKERLVELQHKLRRRGYPAQLIEDALKKATTLDRKELLKVKEKTPPSKDQVIFISKYNPTRADPVEKLREACAGLKYSIADMPDKIIAARKQPPNLKRILSLSKKRDQNSQIGRTETNITTGLGKPFIPCKDKRCKTCPASITEGTYTTQNGTILERNQTMYCKSKDLIYLITCNGCRGEYIGETGNSLSNRMNLHRSHISSVTNGKLRVSKHIRECAIGLDEKFKIFAITKCDQGSHYYREEVEHDLLNKVLPFYFSKIHTYIYTYRRFFTKFADNFLEKLQEIDTSRPTRTSLKSVIKLRHFSNQPNFFELNLHPEDGF